MARSCAAIDNTRSVSTIQFINYTPGLRLQDRFNCNYAIGFPIDIYCPTSGPVYRCRLLLCHRHSHSVRIYIHTYIYTHTLVQILFFFIPSSFPLDRITRRGQTKRVVTRARERLIYIINNERKVHVGVNSMNAPLNDSLNNESEQRVFRFAFYLGADLFVS